MLIAFAGLAGTGKTTLARALAQQLGATYLRIDTIERALRASAMLADQVGPAGYLVAYALAEANLRLGQIVIADSVNPLRITREAWRHSAANGGSRMIEVEIICSDPAEHRRRVETRSIDIEGLAAPNWQAVIERDYEPWDRPPIVIDTAGRTSAESLAELLRKLPAAASVRPPR